jgi:hypothetical protein
MAHPCAAVIAITQKKRMDEYASASKRAGGGGLKLALSAERAAAAPEEKKAPAAAPAAPAAVEDALEASLEEKREKARRWAERVAGEKRERDEEGAGVDKRPRYAMEKDEKALGAELGVAVAEDDPSLAGMTEAERKHELHRRAREAAELEVKAKETHRERVDKFNERLAKQPIHNDIPRIAAAGLG